MCFFHKNSTENLKLIFIAGIFDGIRKGTSATVNDSIKILYCKRFYKKN